MNILRFDSHVLFRGLLYLSEHVYGLVPIEPTREVLVHYDELRGLREHSVLLVWRERDPALELLRAHESVTHAELRVL